MQTSAQTGQLFKFIQLQFFPNISEHKKVKCVMNQNFIFGNIFCFALTWPWLFTGHEKSTLSLSCSVFLSVSLFLPPSLSLCPCLSVLLALSWQLLDIIFHLCFTSVAGIVLTWSGLGGDNLVHQALGGIIEDLRFANKNATNLAAIATPLWAGVDPDIKQQLTVKVRKCGYVYVCVCGMLMCIWVVVCVCVYVCILLTLLSQFGIFLGKFR